MKKLFLVFPILIMTVMFFNQDASIADERLDKRVERSSIVFDEIMQMPEENIPSGLISNCSAIAIFPFTLKGGFIWGGRYGQGVVLYRDPKTGAWSPPAFFTIGGVSWGLQIGGEAIDLILVLIGENAMQGLLKDNFTLGGDAAVAAGPVGRNAEVSTDLLLKGGIFSYSRTKGLFAGIALKGAIVTPNNPANRRYYGEAVSSREILIKREIEIPDSARQLIETIAKYTK